MDLLERDGLLATLRAELAATHAGDGRLVFIGGEAGIGKSSLLRAFRRTLPDGVEVLLGACDPLPTPRPLGPLLDMAPALPHEVTDPLDAGRRDEVFRALHRHLHARRTPLVMVIEDVHWADEATLDLLRFLGRRLDGAAALLLVSYRDDEVGGEHPLRLLLGDVAASPQIRRLGVPPLSAEGVAAMASDSDLGADELHRATRGNPFFVSEILAAGTGLPESVRDAVLARAARHTPDARAYLDAAAVIGDRIELTLLERIAAAPRTGLDEALVGGMLLRSGDVGSASTLLAFRHELARRTLLDALTVSRRRDLHQRVLAALGNDAGADPPLDDLALLAHHAEGAGDGETVLRYAPIAARRARELEAHREAAAQFERALRFAAGLPDEDHADLLFEYARECDTVDRLDDGTEAYRRALQLWRRLGDREREGATMAWLVQNLVLNGRNEDAETMSLEALALLEPLPPGPALAWATVVQALLRMLHRDGPEGVRWSERALELADRLGDRELLTRATNILGSSLIVTGDLGRGRAQLERSLELARTNGNRAGVGVALSNLGSAHGEMHRFPEADDYLERAVAHGREYDLEANRIYSLSWLALTRLHLGRWDEAARAAHEVLGRPHAPISRIMAHLALGRLRARRGDPEVWKPLDAALALAEPTGTLQRLAPVRAARAEAAWLADEPERAASEARAAYAMAEDRNHAWFVGELAYWRWKAGDLGAAPARAAEPYALQMAGRSREAAEAWRALGCPYEAARALAESDDPADRAEALAALEALGAEPLQRRLRRKAENGAAGAEVEPFVRLFGPPAIRFSGTWHRPPFGKTAALLYHLAYRGDWVTRGDLILLLWPDVSDRSARASLRNLLSHTARTLPYAVGLEVEPQRVRWRVATDRDGDDPAGAGWGILLDGFDPPNLPDFARWLEGERATLAAQRRASILERAGEVAASDPGVAAGIVAALLEDDPLDEAAVRLLLGYLRAAGRDAEAVDRYRRFRGALWDEVGGEPGEATDELVADLL